MPLKLFAQARSVRPADSRAARISAPDGMTRFGATASGKSGAVLSSDFGAGSVGLWTGAATHWTADLAERFAGLAVVIDPDREESKAAQGFVENTVRALFRVARSVEVC